MLCPTPHGQLWCFFFLGRIAVTCLITFPGVSRQLSRYIISAFLGEYSRYFFGSLRVNYLDTLSGISWCKVHPIRGHECPEGEYKYRCTLSLTSALYGGGVINATPRPLCPRQGNPSPIVEEAGWAPEPIWTGAENPAPTRIRSPERPTRSRSLYRLRYPDPPLHCI
jgi:hypothetical protein